ncbi:S1C family serine protease [Amycolatopsis sacchari]|uniref:S1C family serine protease n=1 Tax=Amycolatopsis sacchari TaxID=115433 RepID=UPI003D70AF6B
MSSSPQPRRPSPGPLATLGLVLGAVVLTVLVGTGFLVGTLHHDVTARSLGLAPETGTNQNQDQNTGGNLQSLDPGAIAEKVDPGLVDVNTTLGYQNAQAAGTGMVLTSDGLVLTNNHVVEGATSISVTDIGNGKTYRASVVGYDRSDDVAVLKLKNASGLATVTVGDSSKVAVGDAVVGIGNAGGTGGTPSVAPGTVTALDRSITASDESSGSSEQLRGLIEVNANIQSGDSGGALVNSSGQVIGMNTAASTGYRFGGPEGQAQTGGGTGYAIPVNQALSIARQIQAGTASGTVHIGASAFLGVSVADSQSGALVRQVVSGAPADDAGIAAGDTLTGVNGKTVDSATTLTTLMDGLHPGDKVSLTWTGPTGEEHNATVTLVEGPVG